MQPFEFLAPPSLEEALELLARYGDGCRVVAGGTDIVPALREGRLPGVTRLVDIRRRPELRGLKATEKGLWIGAATTHSEIGQSLEVRRQWSLLAEACGQIGSKQIRNLATIGGNVANASPAADSIPALLCLDARVSLLSLRGKREISLQAYLAEKSTKSAAAAGAAGAADASAELLEGFTLPRPLPDTKSTFIKVARRQAMAISRLSLAMALHQEGGKVDSLRLVPGAMLKVPHHLEPVEEFLRGKVLTAEVSAAAVRLAADVVIAETGLRSSFKYKIPVLEGLLERTFDQFREREANHG